MFKAWILFFLLVLTGLNAGENYTKEGKKVYDKLCTGCHRLTIPAEKGPSLQMVANRLKKMTKTKKMSPDFQRGVVLGYIRNYTLHPKLMRGAAQGLLFSQYKDMPSIKGKLTREELNAAAIWLYDNFVVTEPQEFKDLALELEKIEKENVTTVEENSLLSFFNTQDLIVVGVLVFFALIANVLMGRKKEEPIEDDKDINVLTKKDQSDDEKY